MALKCFKIKMLKKKIIDLRRNENHQIFLKLSDEFDSI